MSLPPYPHSFITVQLQVKVKKIKSHKAVNPRIFQPFSGSVITMKGGMKIAQFQNKIIDHNHVQSDKVKPLTVLFYNGVFHE